MATIWGQSRKAGKTRRPEQVPAPGAVRSTPGNATGAPGWRYGSNPIAFDYAHRLGVATVAPILRGRFRGLDSADPTRAGNGRPDLGALQSYRGMVGMSKRLRAGMQGGPSSPAGYPSTGNGNTVIAGLANMSRPGVQRIRGL